MKVRAKDTVKTAEIILSAYVAVHSSVRSIDHLSEMLRSHGAKSVYEDIKIHRTKCYWGFLEGGAEAGHAREEVQPHD